MFVYYLGCNCLVWVVGCCIVLLCLFRIREGICLQYWERVGSVCDVRGGGDGGGGADGRGGVGG